jgi:Rieske Fe-S protein
MKDERPGDAADRPEDPARRKLFASVAAGAGVAIAGALGAPLVRFVLAPLAGRASRARVRLDLGPASAFDATREGKAGPHEVILDRALEDAYMTRRVKERVLIVRDAGAPSGLAALSPTCSHLGCGVAWSAERNAFLCPCHGGVYAADGKVLGGPPPRPLGRLPLVVEGGRVRVDVEKLA